MTQRNPLDLNELVNETRNTLTKLVESLEKYYACAMHVGEVEQFVKSVCGTCTWLISSLKKTCNIEPSKTEIPKVEIPPGAEVHLKLSNLTMNKALLIGITTNHTPKLTSLINDFLETPNDPETATYKFLKTECDNTLALLQKLDPILINLLEATNAEIAKHEAELKQDSTAPKNQ